MNKRQNPVFMVVVAATFGLCITGLWFVNQLGNGGVKQAQKPTSSQSSNGELTLLGDTFSGYSTFRSPGFEQALKAVGLNFHYRDEFDQAKRANLLNTGDTDLVVTTLDQFLKQKPQGRIVGLIDRTVGADAVILNTKKYPQLKSLGDLAQLVKQTRSSGKQLKIAFAGDTASEFLALVLSSKFEAFKLSDFQAIKVADASDAWKELQDPNQNVAIAIIWEPYVTKARQKGYTVLLSSKDAPEAIVDVIVASNRILESQPEKISNLLEAYYRRIDANIRDASQLQAQIAEDGKLSAAEAGSILQGIEFFTAKQAKDWLTNGTLEKRISSTVAVLKQAGKLNSVPANPQELSNAGLIAIAANNTQKLINAVRANNQDLAQKLEGKSILASNVTLDPNQIKTATEIGNLEVKEQIKFKTDSEQLTVEGKETLNNVAKQISEFNEQTVAVQIIGHTSKFGKADFNLDLSQQRAQTVTQYLRSLGIKHQIASIGKGSGYPLPDLDPQDKRNQRTEIRLVRVE
jgi:OmpA-OmpF porin, OOP family